MNILAIDYGSKRIGLALSVMGVITPLSVIKNDSKTFDSIQKIITEFKVEKVFVGLSEGKFAQKTISFVEKLSSMLKLPVETIEEAVSTIEADAIYIKNQKNRKDYKSKIDSIAAAVILRRALN